MKRLCQNYNFQHEQKYPFGDKLLEFNRHLIFDDQRKVIYCFVPKVCLAIRSLMLVMCSTFRKLGVVILTQPTVNTEMFFQSIRFKSRNDTC